MIVVDTNLLVYLYVPSARTAKAEAVFEQDPLWVSAYLWRSEFRNTLVGLVRQGNLSLETVQHMAQRAESFMAGREYTVVTDQVLRLAGESRCSAYDCEFVTVAQDLGVPLVTADRQLLRAFPATAVNLDEFVR